MNPQGAAHMSTEDTNDPQHWRNRAAQLRALAVKMAGTQAAVEAGKQLGRPRIDPGLEKRILTQLRAGKGMLKVAAECGVGAQFSALSASWTKKAALSARLAWPEAMTRCPGLRCLSTAYSDAKLGEKNACLDRVLISCSRSFLC